MPRPEKEPGTADDGAAARPADEKNRGTAPSGRRAARTAGAKAEQVDNSTYELTLRRPFEPTVPEWSGTVRGRAQVFSTPTLHLVTAGTRLLAFDRSNKKAWEAVLGDPVQAGRSDSDLPEPFFETPGRLFFADGASLTAFDSASGEIAWRQPAFGVRKIVMDADGFLYVQFGNSYAGVPSPNTMRVNSADGTIEWQVEKYKDVWASGKDVYALRESQFPIETEDQVFNMNGAPEPRVKLYKVNRITGNPLWDWFQPRCPLVVEAQGKSVALLFGEELQIIKSICW